MTNVNVREAVMLSAGMLNMIPGGDDWYKTSRTDAGTFTDDTLRRIWGLGILFDQADDGAGGGGGSSILVRT